MAGEAELVGVEKVAAGIGEAVAHGDDPARVADAFRESIGMFNGPSADTVLARVENGSTRSFPDFEQSQLARTLADAEREHAIMTGQSVEDADMAHALLHGRANGVEPYRR